MFELFTILTSPTVSSDSEALGSVCVNCPLVCGCGTEASTIYDLDTQCYGVWSFHFESRKTTASRNVVTFSDVE